VIPGTGLSAVLDAPEHPVQDGVDGYGGMTRKKLPRREVIDMRSKPTVSSEGSPWGYPESDVPPLSAEQLADIARRNERFGTDMTDGPIHGTPGMGRDYRPTKWDPQRSVGLPGVPGDLNADDDGQP
jgi:hypothetical protein